MKFLKAIFLLTVLANISCKNEGSNNTQNQDQKTVPNRLFEKIPSSLSNIGFSNDLVHDVSTRENLFDYDYFYNGAGVGVIDLNNDGLEDLFFCGNQVSNRLYLNKGNFVFEDVSEHFGVASIGKWSNGVTIVDINQDGWKDIYVTQGGPYEPEQRKNLLFINQDGKFFEELAEVYGLADQGDSTNATFFDFDKDGDLDCLVLNENDFYGIDPITLKKVLSRNDKNKSRNTSRLYENVNGKFIDITRKAGIEKPIYGLGLAVSDFNQDGWPDIYMTSDYYLPDVLFINNQNGTFTDRIKDYTQQISFFGMGMDIADINNDGREDIFVLDMASNDHFRSKTLMASMDVDRFDYLVNKEQFQHQYMFNSLQLNMGENIYNNVAHQFKMAKTDWSWSVLMNDFDLDGFKDVYITNGYRRYALDNDTQMAVFRARQKYNGNVPLTIKEELYTSMPSEKLSNVIFRNNLGKSFNNVAQAWGLNDLTFSNGTITADLDNDGDLDIVVNNIDDKALVYKNRAREEERGNYLKLALTAENDQENPKVKIYIKGIEQTVEIKRLRGYRSSQQNIAHFGIGPAENVDSVLIKWPNGKIELLQNVAANQTVKISKNNAHITSLKKITKDSNLFDKINSKSINVSFVHKENAFDDYEQEELLPYKQSTFGPFVETADINKDGLPDFHVGGASGQSGKLYLQRSNGKFEDITPKDFLKDSAYEDMASVFFDLENDGDLDLFVVSGGSEFPEASSLYEDRIYINDGAGRFTRKEQPSLQKSPMNGRTVAKLDFDRDGDDDIIVGNGTVPFKYPIAQHSLLFENRKGNLVDVTNKKAPILNSNDIINAIEITDFNKDGWPDFIAVGEWSGVRFFENVKGVYSKLADNGLKGNENGWWFNVIETDVNNDGLSDYIVGNIGENLKFSVSQTNPLKVNANDFDGNGTNDIVLSSKYHETQVPVRGRECSSGQMPFIAKKFETYESFANASLKEIYGDRLETSYEKKVDVFSSILLLNQGQQKFKKIELPQEVQSFPILDFVLHDFNNDGFEDVLVGGNMYNTEVETPRLDAVSGVILLSNGKDGYAPKSGIENGLILKGNLKSLAKLKKNDDAFYLLSAFNDGPISIHRFN